jgi:hypothetical protein
MSEVRRRALVPLMRAWVFWTEPRVNALLRPTDAPFAWAPGPNPDRILLFGAGPAMGWGVLTHDLAIPGALARELALHTRRGAEVDVVATRWTVAGTAVESLGTLNLSRYDAIVIMIGVDDARSLGPLAAWRRDIAAILALVAASTSEGTEVFVVGIHPIRSISVFDCLLGGIAGAHAEAMNRVTAELCADQARVTFVPMLAAGAPSEHRFRDAPTYKRWAELLAVRVFERLEPRRSEHREAVPAGRGQGI